MTFSVITSGRLCFRELTNSTALVGVVTLDPSFVANETDCFALTRLDNGQWAAVALEPEHKLPLTDEQRVYGLSALLTTPVWRTPANDHTVVVRFTEAFPEDNTWALAGVSNRPLSTLPLPFPDEGIQGSHLWVDLQQGQASRLETPFAAQGMAMGQLLTQQAIWPNAQGALHTLSTLPTATRQDMFDYHQRVVQAIHNGETDEELRAAIQANPRMRAVAPYSLPDMEYAHYLAKLSERGALEMDRPRTADEVEAGKAVRLEVMRELQAEENLEETWKARLSRLRR